MIEPVWAGGEHRFELRIEHLRALQERCDAGPMWVLTRLGNGQWRIDDIVSTIRLGLEGGGLPKDQARALVQQHVEEPGLITRSIPLARSILMDALFGVEDDPVGEQAGEAETKPTDSPAAAGGSPDITAGAPSSESVPETSTTSPSGNSTPASTAMSPRTAEKTRHRRR